MSKTMDTSLVKLETRNSSKVCDPLEYGCLPWEINTVSTIHLVAFNGVEDKFRQNAGRLIKIGFSHARQKG
jgi:hypothetical protein